MPNPTLYSIPPERNFVDALAATLLARWRDDPLALSDALILLPTRRACRSLREAFLRVADGRALLLPRMLPLGDLDADELLLSDEAEALFAPEADLPPAMPPLRRQLLLARLVKRWGDLRGERDMPQDQAVRLAGELGRLLDQVDTEGLSLERLVELVPERYATHWGITLGFLDILQTAWPDLQAAEGCIGPAERRRRLIEAQAAAWQTRPPEHPVIAAGSTGSIPATARLLSVIARLPQGEVVLPGLERDAPEPVWREIERDPVHPQHTMALLLRTMEIDRGSVRDWPGAGTGATAAARPHLLNLALRPAEASDDWRGLAATDHAELPNDALSGLQRIDCPGAREEALVIALLLRQALETPQRTAALVTPDRNLARRVAAELGRWGLLIDDSAGQPLEMTPFGSLLRLMADAAASDLAPLPLLSLLKHPLAAGGLAPGRFRVLVRRLELTLLRGPRPAPGLGGLERALAQSDAGGVLRDLLKRLRRCLGPFLDLMAAGRHTLPELMRAHIAALEALAESDALSGAERLWRGDAGEAAAAFADDVLEAGAAAIGADDPLARIAGHDYPALLDALLAGRAVRPRYGRHPRLAILGPLEARLQHCDLLVLGGLNEESWPAPVDAGPWLSRPMRRDFGLPLPERRIGLAAHDFVQACTAPQVYLTRATRVEGTPTVPSRWLLRLDAVLRGLDRRAELMREAPAWLAWAEQLDRARDGTPRAVAGPPAPRPPLAARPRKLSITRIETWIRDPYSLYASEILKLHPLDPIDALPGAAERGSLIHAALETFLRQHARRLPADPAGALRNIGEKLFQAVAELPGLYSFWWPRFCKIADWFAEQEAARRPALDGSVVEARGELSLDGPAGPFVLTGIADRIDRRADGRLEVLDYKTGAVPRGWEVETGLAPQLPLEALMAEAGAFPDLRAGPVGALAYWRLGGGDPAGEVIRFEAPEELIEAAENGLRQRIALFDDPATPYRAQPRADLAPAYSPYDHLARVKEWRAGDLPAGSEGA